MFGLYAIIWIIVNLLIIILFNFSQTRLSKTRKQVLTVTFWDIFIIVSLYFHIYSHFTLCIHVSSSCDFMHLKKFLFSVLFIMICSSFLRSGKNMLLKYNEDPWHWESYFQDEMKIIWAFCLLLAFVMIAD